MLASTASRNKLAYTDRVQEGQPPRGRWASPWPPGIFVNFLWVRANDLKLEGKFFELNQLAGYHRCSPGSPASDFHAWNMAYNISVSTQTRTGCWYWSSKGLALLRDKASGQSQRSAAPPRTRVIFLHKIGGVTDDANRYHKMKLAEEWTTILGVPPLKDPKKDRSRDHAIGCMAAWLQPIADAPRLSRRSSKKHRPSARSSIASRAR